MAQIPGLGIGTSLSQGCRVLHVVGIELAKAEGQEAMLYSEAGDGCSLEYEGEQ